MDILHLFSQKNQELTKMRFLASKSLQSTRKSLKQVYKELKHPKPSQPHNLNILCFGYPGSDILEEKCKDLKSIDEKLTVYLESLKITAAFNNLLSLSSIQVGIGYRFFVMLRSFKEVHNFSITKQLLPKHYCAIINPRILEYSDLQDFAWENCASFPAIKSRVKRPVAIKVDYYNEKFELENQELMGLGARVFQHEVDHLDGKNIMSFEVCQGDYVARDVSENMEELMKKNQEKFIEMLENVDQLQENNQENKMDFKNYKEFQEKIHKISKNMHKNKKKL